MAELFEATCGTTKKNTLVELTSSGMTHSWGTRSPGWTGEMPLLNLLLKLLMVACQTLMPWNYRSIRANGAAPQGAYYLGLNFGEIDLDFEKEELTIQVIGQDDQAALSQTWSFRELDILEDPEAGDFKCGPRRGEESIVHLYLARLAVVTMFAAPLLLVMYFPYFVITRLVRTIK